MIKARVMNKGPIKTWSNAKGEGKLFSMELCDESGEIRVTAFRDAVDKFYDMIQVFIKYSLRIHRIDYTLLYNKNKTITQRDP